MTDEELRLTDRYKVELENAIYYQRPRTDRETELIELLILEKIRAIKALEKENAELKKEISVLLSCVNCPENKGGYICEKEYNDKCLSQKIEYIKELKEENEDLRNFAETLSENHANEWQEQQQVITELHKKLDKVSKWIKEQECPDGCIDCSAWDTYKLKEILK